MAISTISSVNRLPPCDKREAYTRLIPQELMDRFRLTPELLDQRGRDLLSLNCSPGSCSTEMELRHRFGCPDPVLYGHITDTVTGQIHILLYILNDPDAPRFNVDCLQDGTPTAFGTEKRNIPAEVAALEYGLAPGQIRRGLRMLTPVMRAFEAFVLDLGHDIYFAEPLYYHTAVMFERHGFSYQKGQRLMECIDRGFEEDGNLLSRLDASNPFRMPAGARNIRLRSWAVHDGILGHPFTDVIMYKRIGHPATLNTCPGCSW